MSSHPSWSTGCHACRRMKVKCDEAKPECARCKRAGRTCPGFRDASQMRFRSMNASVAAKAIAPVSTKSIIPSKSSSPQLSTPPSTNWEQYAAAHFIDHFVELPLNGAPGYLEFLPHMLNASSECLQEAFHAVSMANIANLSCMRHLELASREHYGRALRALRNAMGHELTAMAYETWTAIYLLQKYEIFTGAKRLSSDPHEAVTTAMIRLRGIAQPLSNDGQSLYRVLQIRKQIQALSGDPGTTIPEFNGNSFHLSAPGSVFWSLLKEASTMSTMLQNAMLRNSNECEPTDTSFNDTLIHASTVYSRLLSWRDSIPTTYKYKVLSLPPETGYNKIPGYVPKELYLFNYTQHGAMWITYWCGCIHLAQNLLQSYRLFYKISRVSLVSASSKYSERWIWESLLVTIGDVCASAPCLLGDVDGRGQLNVGGKSKALGAFFLLRALNVANSVENLPIDLRRLLLNYLGRIGTAVGIKRALREKEDWLASHQREAGELMK